MTHIDIETVGKILGSLHGTAFACPFCGHEYEGAESEAAQFVVSLWGEDDHDFCCDECGKDFVVRETVLRSFETAATSDCLDRM